MATRSPADKIISIELVQFQRWLLVRDLSAYKTLLKVGLPLTKIHIDDNLPIIKPLLRKAGIRLIGKPWIREFEDLFQKLGEFLKRPEAIKIEGDKFWVQLPSEKACDNLQTKLNDWFRLRSFSVQFARRRRDNYWMLRGETVFDRTLQPVFIEPGEDDPPTILDLDLSNELAFYRSKSHNVEHVHIRWNAKSGEADEPIMVRDIPIQKFKPEQLLAVASFLISVAQRIDPNKGEAP